MNKGLIALLLVSLNGLVAQAFAENNINVNDAGSAEQERAFFIEGATGIDLSQEAEETNLYWRAGAGYRLNQYFEMGVALSSLDDGISHSESIEAFMRPMFYLDDGYSLYSELGYRDEGDGLFAGLGAKYKLAPSWEVNLGYRWYQEPISEARGDSYTLAIGLQYLFGQSNRYPPVSSNDFAKVAVEPAPVVKVPAVVAPIIILPVVLPETCRTTIALSDLDHISQVYQPNDCNLAKRFDSYQGCHSVLNTQNIAGLNSADLETHVIVQSAWLIAIAHEHCIALEAMIELNPWIKSRIGNDKYVYPEEQLILPVRNSTRILK